MIRLKLRLEIAKVFGQSAQAELDQVTANMDQVATELVNSQMQLEQIGGVEGTILEDGKAQFTTKGGYVIKTDTNLLNGHTTEIFDKDGNTLFKINGDPHVDVNGDGVYTPGSKEHLEDNSLWDFHYGDDSTVILPDGSKVYLNSVKSGGVEGVYANRGVVVESGEDVLFTGVGYDDNMLQRQQGIVALENFDGDAHLRGTEHDSALVFGYHNNDVVIQNEETGLWHELKDESWMDYLKDQTFDDQLGAVTNYRPVDQDSMRDGIEMKESELNSLVMQQIQAEDKLAEQNSVITDLEQGVQVAEQNLQLAVTGQLAIDDTQVGRHELEQENHNLTLENTQLMGTMKSSGLFEELPAIEDIENVDFAAQDALLNMEFGARRKAGMNDIDRNRLNDLAGA